MNSNNILRLALVLSSSQAHTFNKNLNKLVKLALYDSYSIPIKVTEIVKSINDCFSLEFTDSEVLLAIKDDSGIVVHIATDPMNNLYELTPDEYQKISIKQNIGIDSFISHFLQENDEYQSLAFEEIKELIYRYIYFTFNSDTQTLLILMNKDNNGKENYCVAKEFSAAEADVINSFLNWDNKAKNEFILNLISSCFDYCMLTVKKDNNSYASVLNGKEFFLDANIVFRLAGFNKLERQNVMNAFIKKCIDSNIKICYTNHTYEEIKNTIKYHVNGIKGLLNKDYPISLKAMSVMSSKYANLDFYEKYVVWCKENPYKVGDFVAFQSFLESEIKTVLRPFNLIVFEDFNTGKNANRFSELSDDFQRYKFEHYKNTYEGAIKTDINNYLFMIDKNSSNAADNFMQLKYYFITADHCLTEWSSLKRPGTIPLFVLPSVWYSILLKYKGRTNDDYTAFCQFLNIPISPEKDKFVDEKLKMLSYVLGLKEDSSIKDQIIFDIEARLANVDTEITDPIAFAEQSHQTILQEKLAEQEERNAAETEQKIQAVKENLNEAHQSEIVRIKTETEISSNKKHQEGYEAGYEEAKKDIFEKEVKRIVKRNGRIKIAVNIILAILLSLSIVAIIAILIFKGSVSNKFTVWYNDNGATILILTTVVTALTAVVKKILKQFGFLSTDEKEITDKLSDRFNS